MPDSPKSFSERYTLFVKDNDLNLVPSVVMALGKLDANKDAGKRKALADAALAALTKWETDQKLGKLADELHKLKEAIQPDLAKGPPPPPPMPYKKTTLLAVYTDARKDVLFGAKAALADLDNAATLAEAKALAVIAAAALKKENEDLTAEVKVTKDTDRKLKLSMYNGVVGKLLQQVNALAK